MELEISQNIFDSLGVRDLRAGKWPHLESLVLPKRLFLLSVWRWLNLDLAEYAYDTHVFPLTVTRLLLPASTEYWPNLRKVVFA